MKASFPVTASCSSHACPWLNSGLFNQPWPLLSHVPTVPLVLPECFGLSSPSRPALPGSPCRPQPREKDSQMGGNRRVFCFLLQEKARLFLAPFSTNQIVVFTKPCVWQASGRGVKNQSSLPEYLCIFSGCQFCLSSSAWLSPVSPDC